jgi:hypothetical protein
MRELSAGNHGRQPVISMPVLKRPSSQAIDFSFSSRSIPQRSSRRDHFKAVPLGATPLINLAFCVRLVGLREFHAAKNGATNRAALHRFEASTTPCEGGHHLARCTEVAPSKAGEIPLEASGGR